MGASAGFSSYEKLTLSPAAGRRSVAKKTSEARSGGMGGAGTFTVLGQASNGLAHPESSSARAAGTSARKARDRRFGAGFVCPNGTSIPACTTPAWSCDPGVG